MLPTLIGAEQEEMGNSAALLPQGILQMIEIVFLKLYLTQIARRLWPQIVHYFSGHFFHPRTNNLKDPFSIKSK